MKATLFEVVQDRDGVRVSQPDADHIDLEVLIDGQLNTARLTVAQGVACAIAILVSNVGHAMHQAEALDDETSAVLGQAFLLPSARRALERQNAALMPEAN